MSAALAIADAGSTLEGVSGPILGTFLVTLLFVVGVVLPTLRQRDKARRAGRKVDGRPES